MRETGNLRGIENSPLGADGTVAAGSTYPKEISCALGNVLKTCVFKKSDQLFHLRPQLERAVSESHQRLEGAGFEHETWMAEI